MLPRAEEAHHSLVTGLSLLVVTFVALLTMLSSLPTSTAFDQGQSSENGSKEIVDKGGITKKKDRTAFRNGCGVRRKRWKFQGVPIVAQGVKN